ncbi:hypothetical protein LXL04_018846 [Taraxacum kok-saghyz]
MLEYPLSPQGLFWRDNIGAPHKLTLNPLFRKTEQSSSDFQEKVMDSMKAKLDMSIEEHGAFLNDPNHSDTTSVRSLGKLLTEIIHTSIQNAIKRLLEKGTRKP